LLDLFERIALGICAVILVLTIAPYYFMSGMPSTTSFEFLQGVVSAEPPPAAKKSTTPEPPSPITPEDQALLDKLREQGAPGLMASQGLPRKQNTVPKQLLEYISAESNWLPEVKKAKSMPIQTKGGPTRIKIFEIQPESLLQKCGLQENDIIELVDGEIMEFTDSNSLAYRNMFRAKIEKLRKGEPLTVTVTRNNKPLHLIFKL
jgi:hypothetical protein